MARGEKNGGDRRLPVWWCTAAIIVGIVCLVGSVSLLFADGESSWRDTRATSRGIILGAALVAFGLFTVVNQGDHRKDQKTRHARDDRPPAPDGTPTAKPDAAGSSINLERMLLHSDDVLATLRDLVLHGKGQADLADLSALLSRSGLMEWEDAPVVRANRLRRNGRWWLTAPDVELDEKAFGRLVGIEGALNVGEDLAREKREGSLDARAREALKVLDRSPKDKDEQGLMAYLLQGSEKGGEWSCRLRFADAVENLPAPLRVEMGFQSNARRGVMCVDVCLPGPPCLSFAADSPEARASLARLYALWLSLALGNLALGPRTGASHVVVNGHEWGSDDCILSLDLTPESLRSLMDSARSAQGELPQSGSLRARTREDGWLDTVEPFMRRDGEVVCPPERLREVELDDSPCNAAVARACGARRVSDLGIMEKAGRVAAWNSIVKDLGNSTQEAVSQLMSLRDSTTDLTVAEACDRASKALVEGSADASDKRGLSLLFVDGGVLANTLRSARRALEGEPTPDQLKSALDELERALSPISEMGVYLDDSDSVYRYFNSIAERIAYNRTVDDGGRTVRLVPDEYYSAHSLAARILNMLGRGEEALAHVEELTRIAPITPDAALGKVRCLEEQSRIFEAADELKRAIGCSATASDMSVCFYRLAYMEWKLGRNDLAVACYQRSIELHPQMAQSAREEMRDLIEANEGLSPYPADEVMPALAAGGLPTGELKGMRDQTRDALVACADAGLFGAARPLASIMLELNRDDALIDVRDSLTRP